MISAKLMEHKIKSQIALFYKASDPNAAGLLKEFEKVATEYAGKIIALYIDVEDGATHTPTKHTRRCCRRRPCCQLTGSLLAVAGRREHAGARAVCGREEGRAVHAGGAGLARHRQCPPTLWGGAAGGGRGG